MKKIATGLLVLLALSAFAADKPFDPQDFKARLRKLVVEREILDGESFDRSPGLKALELEVGHAKYDRGGADKEQAEVWSDVTQKAAVFGMSYREEIVRQRQKPELRAKLAELCELLDIDKKEAADKYFLIFPKLREARKGEIEEAQRHAAQVRQDYAQKFAAIRAIGTTPAAEAEFRKTFDGMSAYEKSLLAPQIKPVELNLKAHGFLLVQRPDSAEKGHPVQVLSPASAADGKGEADLDKIDVSDVWLAMGIPTMLTGLLMGSAMGTFALTVTLVGVVLVGVAVWKHFGPKSASKKPDVPSQ